MGYQSTAYDIVLVAHILAAIFGLGGVSLNALYAKQSQQRPGPGGLAVAEANFAVNMVAEKIIYAVPVLGLLLVWLSDGTWKFSQTWVWLSIVVYVVALAVSHTVLLPGAKKINALLHEMNEQGPPVGGPPPQVAALEALGKRMAAAGGFEHLMLVALIVLMVFKPGT